MGEEALFYWRRQEGIWRMEQVEKRMLAREELLFFLWAIGYQLSWMLPEWLALPGVIPACCLAALLLWCFASGRAKCLFLTRPRGHWVSLWPLALFPAWNLLRGSPGQWETARMLPLLLAAIAEELFFRGAVLSLWERKHTRGGVLVSAVLFAAYHLFSPNPNGVQLLCALAAGVCYGEATLRTGSLFPAMLAHLAVNLTSTWEMGEGNSGLWLCVGVCLLWGFWDATKRRKELLCNFT